MKKNCVRQDATGAMKGSNQHERKNTRSQKPQKVF